MSEAVQYISQEEYEQILESGDSSQLDDLVTGRLVIDETGENLEKQLSNESENKSGEESATPSAEEEVAVEGVQDEVPRGKPVIMSKSGKHTIEFEVLEHSREQTKHERELRIKAENELNELRAKFGDAIKPVEAITQEEALGLTDEDLEHLNEIDPAAGKMAREFRSYHAATQKQIQELNLKISQLSARGEESVTPVDSIHETPEESQAAIDEIPELLMWQAKNPQAFDYVSNLNATLKEIDPNYLKIPNLVDRYRLLVERTNIALGYESKPTKPQAPNKKLVDVERVISELEDNPVPPSLSRVGQSPATQKSSLQKIDGKTGFDLTDAMRSMSDAELDALLRGDI